MSSSAEQQQPPQGPPPDDRLWTVPDVLHYLGVGRSWLYERLGTPEAPPVIRIGAHVRFDPGAVKAWATRRAKGGGKVVQLPPRKR